MTKACSDLFNKRRLVYIPAKRSWVSPDECIWTAASNIGGQFGISATYANFEELFRGILNVQVPTTTTNINQLRDLVSDEPDNIAAIKAAIHSMGRLRPSPEDLRGAQVLRFLPVEKADGSKMLAKVTDAFFIADRIEYQAAFRGKVSMLDFSLEEVCRLHRLFESLSLGDHYMSAAVQERTTVQLPAPEPSSSLTLIFRRKAQHLYRWVISGSFAIKLLTEVLDVLCITMQVDFKATVLAFDDACRMLLYMKVTASRKQSCSRNMAFQLLQRPIKDWYILITAIIDLRFMFLGIHVNDRDATQRSYPRR